MSTVFSLDFLEVYELIFWILFNKWILKWAIFSILIFLAWLWGLGELSNGHWLKYASLDLNTVSFNYFSPSLRANFNIYRKWPIRLHNFFCQVKFYQGSSRIFTSILSSPVCNKDPWGSLSRIFRIFKACKLYLIILGYFAPWKILPRSLKNHLRGSMATNFKIFLTVSTFQNPWKIN